MTPHRLQLGAGDICLCSRGNLTGHGSDATLALRVPPDLVAADDWHERLFHTAVSRSVSCVGLYL